MEIYRFRATSLTSKQFFRLYDLPAEITMFELNTFLVADLDFAPDQMIAFRAVDKDGKVKGVYGMFDLGSGTIDKVTIGQCLKNGAVVLHYIFDLQRNKYLILTFEGESEPLRHANYPCLVQERGRVPGQFDSKNDNLDALDPEGIKARKVGKKGSDMEEDIDDEDFEEDELDNDDEEHIYEEDGADEE